ncbi:MAG: Lcl C-terminal domain-containing protein [Ilumatobacteraceae bacterium]
MGVMRRMPVLALVVGVMSCGGVTGTTNTSTTTVDALNCASGGTCVVGDTGPGGGIVFYDAGSTQSWGRFLEATPSGWSSANSDSRVEWGCYRTSISGATGTAIGTGQANTTAILAGCTTGGIAAQLADALTFGGKSDWFLPSRDELALIYASRAIIGGFAADTYWSSTEHNRGSAWVQYFYNGLQSPNYKGGPPLSVRPVRAFG